MQHTHFSCTDSCCACCFIAFRILSIPPAAAIFFTWLSAFKTGSEVHHTHFLALIHVVHHCFIAFRILSIPPVAAIFTLLSAFKARFLSAPHPCFCTDSCCACCFMRLGYFQFHAAIFYAVITFAAGFQSAPHPAFALIRVVHLFHRLGYFQIHPQRQFLLGCQHLQKGSKECSTPIFLH